MVLIRTSTPDDFVLLVEYEHHIDDDMVLRKLCSDEIYLLHVDGKFAGWLRYGLFWDGHPFMNMLFVLEPYWNQGLGEKLVA
jgi:GNAT superfamily N-acetyltransferase